MEKIRSKNVLPASCLVLACMTTGLANAAPLAGLHGYEWQVPAAESGPAASARIAELLMLANDETEPPYVRARAAHALTVYPTAEVWDFYVNQSATGRPSVERRRAVDNLCLAFAADTQRLQGYLSGLIDDADPQVQRRARECTLGIATEDVAGEKP